MRQSDTAIFIPKGWRSHSGGVVVGRYTVYVTTGRYVFGVICVGSWMCELCTITICWSRESMRKTSEMKMVWGRPPESRG